MPALLTRTLQGMCHGALHTHFVWWRPPGRSSSQSGHCGLACRHTRDLGIDAHFGARADVLLGMQACLAAGGKRAGCVGGRSRLVPGDRQTRLTGS
jgi:hypothetical protein